MKQQYFTAVLLLGLVTAGWAADNPEGNRIATALVEKAVGRVTVVSSDKAEPTSVAAGAVLPAGARVKVGDDGEVVLGFVDGHRWRLTEGATAIVRPNGPELVAGSAEALEPVPALTRLVPTLAEQDACSTRIRGGAARPSGLRLSPDTQSRVVAGPLSLRLEPPRGYSRFRVKLTEGWNGSVLDVETTEKVVVVPDHVLKGGTTYQWSVESLDAGMPRLFEVAVFSTLDDEVAGARARIEDQIAAKDNDDLAALLTVVDQGLCLELPPASSAR